MTGAMGKKARAAAVAELAAKVERGGQVVLVATGSLIGEGFDSPALHTLFLAFRSRSRGGSCSTSAGSCGPMMTRPTLEVHDYVDILSPVLKAMHAKRLPSYAALGLDVRTQRRGFYPLAPQR